MQALELILMLCGGLHLLGWLLRGLDALEARRARGRQQPAGLYWTESGLRVRKSDGSWVRFGER